MRVIERTIEHPEDEGVILEYVKLTKDFAEIKEYVKHKGDTIMGYTQDNACVSIRIEDILYFETVDGNAFAYTADELYKLSGRLYQVEEDVKRSYICRAYEIARFHHEKYTGRGGDCYMRKLPIAHCWLFWYSPADAVIYAAFILFGKIVWHMVDFGVSVKTAADINRLIRNRKRKG